MIRWKCPHPSCDRTFDSFMGLKQHFIEHLRNGVCPICGREYKHLEGHIVRASRVCNRHAVAYGLVKMGHNKGWKKYCRDLAYHCCKVEVEEAEEVLISNEEGQRYKLNTVYEFDGIKWFACRAGGGWISIVILNCPQCGERGTLVAVGETRLGLRVYRIVHDKWGHRIGISNPKHEVLDQIYSLVRD